MTSPKLLVLLLAIVPVSVMAQESWAEGLARKFSGRLDEIDAELAVIHGSLADLPTVPLDDQGGTGGFATLHNEPTGEHAITVEWENAAAVDALALIPARRYGLAGLESQYGTPDAFSVELLDVRGNVVAKVGEMTGVRRDPVRSGHPFFFEVSPPVEASAVRIIATGLIMDGDRAVHAWSEVFAFSGGRNLAAGAEVSHSDGVTPSSPWHWSPAFLVDEQTPLGLPELPAGEHRNIGWLSQGQQEADSTAWLEMDMGEAKTFDSIRLVPARRPTSDLPSGFGFPRTFRIKVSDQGSAKAAESLVIEHSLRNPGHNPVSVSFEAQKGRYVQVEATRMWKPYESFPAFFALSEVEILHDGENVAIGASVRSPDGMGNVIASGARFWSAVSLSDGFGPDGRLVPASEWLGALDQRLKLETRRHHLHQEAGEIISGWRHAGITMVGVVGLAGAFVLVFLPLRYRVRARSELKKVRERIAGDLHDEVGSNLGSIQMFADLAEGRSGPSKELKRIQRIAAETVSAVRDIVWLLRPQGGHRIGTVEHLRETSSIMLEPVEWEFTANEAAWQCELEDEASRDLFLFFREALHNILRHANAKKVILRAEETAGRFILKIRDDGQGIAPEKLERPSTLRALRQRTEALGANLDVETAPGEGTELVLSIPLEKSRRKSVTPGIAHGGGIGA